MKFIRRHKKLVIILSVLLALLITAIILVFTVFSLKEVELEFKTETLNITQEEQGEIQAEILKTGGSVFFVGKEKIINDIEKNHPYIKIVNIETQIPNKFIIHCAEREELYAIESEGKIYFLDEDMKILRIQEEPYSRSEGMPIILSFKNIKYDELDPTSVVSYTLDLNLGACEEGQFLNLKSSSDAGTYIAGKFETISKSILTAFEENNRGIADVRSMYESFEIFFEEEVIGGNSYWHICLKLMLDSTNYQITLFDADISLAEKIQVMFVAYSEAQETPENLIGTKMIIYKEGNEYKYIFEDA